MRHRISVRVVGLMLDSSVACNKPSQTSNDNSAQPSDNSQANGNPADSQNGSAPARRVPTTVTVPSGKVLTVRLADEVGSKVSQPGQTFGGTLARPVDVNGEVAIPAGARVEGVVVDAKPLGRFAGGALLELQLNSVQVNGEQKPVQTAMFPETLKRKGKHTGVLVCGSAGPGALIVGLAGGGQSAALGAAPGAGDGTAGNGFSRNKEIVFPPGSPGGFPFEDEL